jgi:hypothetical protein
MPMSATVLPPVFPKLVCALDIETAGRHALKPDRADLAVVGLKAYSWDEQTQSYHPGPYEHYGPGDFPTLQQRLEALPGPIVGHNLFSFDYRVLRRHLNLGGVVEKSADTLHLLYEMDGGGEEGGLFSLELLASANLGEHKAAKASTIPKLLKDGKVAEVLAYNERDCDLTFRIWWHMVSTGRISAGEVWDDEPEFGPNRVELAFDLKDEHVAALTCLTPRFTYEAWTEQLDRNGWIIMPPAERRRREKERERRRAEAHDAMGRRQRAVREFIEQCRRDDVPPKYADNGPDDASSDAAAAASDVARDLLTRAGLPQSVWAEGMVVQLVQGKWVTPAKLDLAGLPDGGDAQQEATKAILAALAADGYAPHYSASLDPDADFIYLDGPPPTLAQQYVTKWCERYAEYQAMFGGAGLTHPNVRWASNVNFAFTYAMQQLYGASVLVFDDDSYVFDDGEISVRELVPRRLATEEQDRLRAYTLEHPDEWRAHLDDGPTDDESADGDEDEEEGAEEYVQNWAGLCAECGKPALRQREHNYDGSGWDIAGQACSTQHSRDWATRILFGNRTGRLSSGAEPNHARIAEIRSALAATWGPLDEAEGADFSGIDNETWVTGYHTDAFFVFVGVKRVDGEAESLARAPVWEAIWEVFLLRDLAPDAPVFEQRQIHLGGFAQALHGSKDAAQAAALGSLTRVLAGTAGPWHH